MSKIFHAKKPDFGLKKHEFYNLDDYNLVGLTNLTNLDEIFKLTNNIDCNWTENKLIESKKKNIRSTSVGDIILLDDKVYLCEMVGWKELNCFIPLELGELFAGSLGIKCEFCDIKTWTIWLTQKENQLLEFQDRDKRIVACEEKLGKILCGQHSKRIFYVG